MYMEVKNLYKENFKLLKKEVKTLERRKTSHPHVSTELMLQKTLPIYLQIRFNTPPIKILIAFFTEIEKKTILKLIQNHKRLQIVKKQSREKAQWWRDYHSRS